MIQKVRKEEELDNQQLLRFLKENNLLEVHHSELEVCQFSNGYSNLTYLITSDEKEFVIRMPPVGATSRGHDMSREYKVISNLSKSFDKVPRAYIFDDSRTFIDRPFYIMERVIGEIITLKRAKELNLDPTDFKNISNTWLQTFLELHSTNYNECGLGDLGKPDGYVQRQVENWGKQYKKAKTQDVDEADRVMAWLASHQPTSYDHCIIHNDYKYDNVVFSDGNFGHISSILDWEMCTLGDPLMDLGTSIAYWCMPSDPPAIQMGLPSPTLLAGNPGRQEIAELYGERSGRKIDNLVFYYAFGLFKIAVIAQQIYYRYEKGLTTNEKFKHLDKSSKFLCVMAYQAIQKNRIENLF